MKKYTHAWLALKAVEVLEKKKSTFNPETQKSVTKLLKFISEFPSTFVRGAWFPDTVIRDNVLGGHTWKYRFDDNGRTSNYRTPKSVICSKFFSQTDFDKKILLEERISDLPDRCEALSQSIRDMIKITNELKSGDVVAFNNSQIASFFLMLSHYVADAHMPLHCDVRDFYKPSKVHPDIEAIWEKEITKYYTCSKKYQQFDLDEKGHLQRLNKSNYKDSFLYKVDEFLNTTEWDNKGSDWRRFLGSGNNNIWDYLVGVCHVSFLMSHKLLPESDLNGNYNINVMTNPVLYNRIIELSASIISDAINSIALVWFTTWLRWELLGKEILQD